MNKIINTYQAPAAIGPYSQAVQAGSLVFVSGQIPLHSETGLLITDNIHEASHRVMQNVKAILKAANLDFSNVVKATIFLKDMNDFASVNEVYASYFAGNYPARETVQVSRLPKDVQVEISVIASIN